MRIERYTEIYLDDAMRLCKYIAKDDATVRVVMADPALFPDPPKNLEWPDTLLAAQVVRNGEVVAECAYLQRREETNEKVKFRNRWLIALMMGDELRRAREAKGISLEDLAEITGYRSHSIDAMERGRYSLDVKILARLADALDCEIKFVEKTDKSQ